MGRYYEGDINGKFWFAVQSSDDADFFGVTGYQPSSLEYYFDNADIDEVKKGLAECEKELGDNLGKLEKFFEENNSYNYDMLAKAGFNTKGDETRNLLEWYARYKLGKEIEKCITESGSCSFTAEC